MSAEHNLLEVTNRAFGALCNSGFKIAFTEDMGMFALFPVSNHLIGCTGAEVLTFTTAAAQLFCKVLHAARVQKQVSLQAWSMSSVV